MISNEINKGKRGSVMPSRKRKQAKFFPFPNMTAKSCEEKKTKKYGIKSEVDCLF
jgi:hypothetical protein